MATKLETDHSKDVEADKHLYKRDKLGKDEPMFNPFDVGGLCQPFHNADQQGGRRQHHRQVHGDCRVEEVGQAEEGGGVADRDQHHGGQEGHHGLVGKPSFENKF